MLIREKEIFFEKVLILLEADFSIKKAALYILDEKNNMTKKESSVASAICQGSSFYSAVKNEFLLSYIEEALFSVSKTEKELRQIIYALKKFKSKTAYFLFQSILIFFLIGAVIIAAYFGFKVIFNGIIPYISQYLPDFISEKVKSITINIKEYLPLLFNVGRIILVFLLLIAVINPVSCDNFFISRGLPASKIRKYAVLNRFFRVLSLLCSNGINVKEALKIVSVNENNYIGSIIKAVYKSVTSGNPLNKAFEDTKKGFFTAYSIKIEANISDTIMYGKYFEYVAALSEIDFYSARNQLISHFVISVLSFIIFFIISIFLSGLFWALIKIL